MKNTIIIIIEHYLFTLATIIFLATMSLESQAQLYFQQQYDIPVNDIAGNKMDFPWMGGMNNPQFSEIDLNNDGILDLFVFDRSGFAINTFINGGTPNEIDYTLDNQYRQAFPDTLKDWVLLRDYNCDGVMDIFTAHGIDGFSVYKGSFNSDNQLSFSLVAKQLFFSDATIQEGNIYNANVDIPSIADVDGDGDLDILSFEGGGIWIEYFENKSVDNYGNCEQLEFERASTCWGEFYEDNLSSTIILNAGCSEIEGKTSQGIHPGSTLTVFDVDNDEDMDLLIGDFASQHISLIINGGNKSVALATELQSQFPNYSRSADIRIFLASYLVDVDNDGLKDLIIAPNAVPQSQHYRNVWLYKNNLENGIQTFEFLADDFLQDQMIDVNRISHPVFFDYNNNGLQDLIVANFGFMDTQTGQHISRLLLFENIGTETAPAFQLVDEDYLSFSTKIGGDTKSAFRPCFGDIDADGDQDMLIGSREGYIHYFENTSNGVGLNTFATPRLIWQGLDIFQNSTPQLIDVDRDGDLDLLVGHHNGLIEYFTNEGSPTNPMFNNKTSKFWGNIDVREAVGELGYSVPLLVEIQGEYQLLVGSGSGKVRHYENIENNLEGSFDQITDAVVPSLGTSYSSPAIADLDNDGKWEMIVGNYRGGLQLYEMQYGVGTTNPITVANPSVYPNPTQQLLHIDLAKISKTATHIRLFDITGRQVIAKEIPAQQQNYSLQIPEQLTKGVYLLEIKQEMGVSVAKIVIE